MYSLRLFHLFVVAVSVLCLAQASWSSLKPFGFRVLAPRQADKLPDDAGPTGSSPDTAAASAPRATKAAPTDTENTRTANKQQPTVEVSNTDATSRNTSPKTTAKPTSPSSSDNKPDDKPDNKPDNKPDDKPDDKPDSNSNSNSDSNSDKPDNPPPSTASTQSAPANDGGKDNEAKSRPTPVVTTSIQTITKTGSDGSMTTTTSPIKVTSTPGLNSDASAATSGMSPKTRDTVIGVVVGIGGAIVLGALGLVAWRVWGRRRNSEESDGLMDYNMGLANMEKPEPAGSIGHGQRNPFQSTLENYHQPTQVNASSNF